MSFCACPAGRGDRHTEAGFVFQREAACGAQTETGHHSSERAQNQLQQRLARHAELSSVSYSVCVCERERLHHTAKKQRKNLCA